MASWFFLFGYTSLVWFKLFFPFLVFYGRGVGGAAITPFLATDGGADEDDLSGLLDDGGGDLVQRNVSIDDTSPFWVYDPPVCFLDQGKCFGEGWIQMSDASGTDTSVYFNDTLTRASRIGATATLNFTGRAVYYYASVGSDGGVFSISIDGGSPVSVDTAPSGSSVNSSRSSLVFHQTGLDESVPHTLTVKILAGPFVDVDRVDVTRMENIGQASAVVTTVGQLPSWVIAIVAIGSSLFAIIAMLISYFVIRARKPKATKERLKVDLNSEMGESGPPTTIITPFRTRHLSKPSSVFIRKSMSNLSPIQSLSSAGSSSLEFAPGPPPRAPPPNVQGQGHVAPPPGIYAPLYHDR